MSYWDIKNKVNKLIQSHKKSKIKNRVIPWFHRDEFVNRGQHSRHTKDSKLEKQYWKNWRELKDD
jgi:hypothetical protein